VKEESPRSEVDALRQRVAEVEAREAALLRIAEAASDARDMREFYATVHAAVAELITATNFYIALHDPVRNRINFPYYVDEVDDDVPDPDAWAPIGDGLGAGLTAYVLRTGKPVLVDQVGYETLVETGEVAAVGADSLDWIGIPLRAEGKTLGVLAVQTYDENVRFDAKDRDVLAQIGHHVAVALERVRLHEETRQHLRELKAVNRIGQALAAQLDLDGLIALVGALIEEIFVADVTYVAFLEPDTAMISFPFYSESGMPSERPEVPLGDGPTSRVLRSEEPLLLHGSAEFGGVGERLVGTAEGSYLGVPILAGGRTIGVLSVQTTVSDSRYGETDARLLATVAAGVAIGIQNTRLLESQRASERRYRELVESIPIAVYRSSVDARNASEYMSERAVAIFGYPVEAWYDDDFFESILHPDDHDWVLAENDLEPTEDDSVWVSEYRVIAADGRTVWVRDESWTVRGDDGTPQFVQGCMIDVTEQKQAQLELAAASDALRQAEQRSRRLIEELPMAVYTDKPDTTATSTYISPRVEAMFGYPQEAWMDESFFASVVHPDDYDRLVEKGVVDLSGSDESASQEYRLIAADGRVVWVRDDQWIVRDEQGEPLHIQGFLIDITAQHEASLEIRRQKQYFESLVEVSPVAVVVTDRDERISGWNPAATTLFGYQVDEAAGRTIDELLLPSQELKDEGADVTRETLETGRAQRITQRVRKDGSPVDVEMLMVSLLIEGEHTGYYVMYHDISDLQQARQEAEAATEVKSAFLATMSHEIRTPMNAVIGMTGLLLDTELDEEQRGFAQVISSSGDALLHIIDDILDYSKIEAGRLELDAHPFDLRECIEGALEILAPRAAGKDVELGCLIAADVPVAVVGDAPRLRQVLLNLLSNAVKFTDQGEIVVTVERGVGDVLQLDVRDTGIGIPADRIHRLFESFSQVDASISRRYGGTGLGLAISRRLVELMGGTITVESEAGTGSTFHVTITAEAAALPRPEYARPQQPELEGRRVLIVDDNATNREILSRQAASWGMIAEAEEKPVDALFRLRRGDPFDVAVLDMQMPEMDGLTLAREIRRLPMSLPLVLATSLGGLTQTRGSTDFAAQLTKPIRASQLYEALLEALGAASDVETVASDGPAGPTASGGEGELRILVAEDNAVNQMLAMRLLAKLGYSGDLAENGLEVLDALARVPYDVILMDVQMPELDGLGATRRIVEEHGTDRPRIIAMTANAMQGDREACLAAGMDDYVAKPIKPDLLANALARCKPRG
jgi:PAS domain S-box-containing protein